MLRIYFYLVLGWLAFVVLAILLRNHATGKYLRRFSYVVFLLLFVEAICVVGFYVKTKRWYFQEQANFARTMFEPHPYIVGKGKPNAHVSFKGISYSHNCEGFRGPDFPAKSKKTRVIAIGGSTTYGVNVNDNDTWPAQLGDQLGPEYEVFNMGIIGHSTAEHLGLMSMIVPDYQPDMVVLHVGLNDLRSVHLKDLSGDYSNYQASTLFSSLGFCSASPLDRFASGKLAIWLLQSTHVLNPCTLPTPNLVEDSTPQAEERAKRIYVRNLENLVAVARANGLKPILVPQVLVKESIKGGRLKWWIPFVEDDQLLQLLAAYNKLTEEVAHKDGLYFASEILDQPWTAADFADPSHLNREGNRKFAAVLQRIILKLRTQDS